MTDKLQTAQTYKQEILSISNYFFRINHAVGSKLHLLRSWTRWSLPTELFYSIVFYSTAASPSLQCSDNCLQQGSSATSGAGVSSSANQQQISREMAGINRHNKARHSSGRTQETLFHIWTTIWQPVTIFCSLCWIFSKPLLSASLFQFVQVNCTHPEKVTQPSGWPSICE